MESFRSSIGHALAFGFVAMGLGVIWHAGHIFLLIFAGGLGAIALASIASLIERGIMLPRSLALSVVIVGLVGTIGAAIYLGGAQFMEEARELGGNAGKGLHQLYRRLAGSEIGGELLADFDQKAVLGMLPSPWGVASGARAVVSATLGAVTAVLVIAIIAVAAAAHPAEHRAAIKRLFPKPAHERLDAWLADTGDVLRRWLFGKLVSMAAVSLLSYIGLRLLDVQLAFALSVAIGALTFIPYLGPAIGGGLMILVAAGQSLQLALSALGFYCVVQVVESYLLTPTIEARTTSMPAGAIIAIQLLAGALFGLLGLALATPMGAVALSALEEVRREPR